MFLYESLSLQLLSLIPQDLIHIHIRLTNHSGSHSPSSGSDPTITLGKKISLEKENIGKAIWMKTTKALDPRSEILITTIFAEK